jgi:ADP-ribose pyrophosphatase
VPPGTGRVNRQLIHAGRVIDVGVDTVRFPDGSMGELDLVEHAGASAVVPFVDPPQSKDPRILLLRQYRYAAGGYMYEVPAGMPAFAGEPWDDCAHRELEEETGFRARRLEPMTRIYTTPGFSNEIIHLWAAWELERGSSNLDDDEFLDVIEVPLSQVMEWIRTRKILDAKSLVALLFAATFRPVV